MSGRYNAADADRSSLGPGYRALERILSYFARLQPDEGRRPSCRRSYLFEMILQTTALAKSQLLLRAKASKRMAT